MDIRKVKKLIELLEESGIAEIEISEGEESVRISRYSTAAQPTPTDHAIRRTQVKWAAKQPLGLRRATKPHPQATDGLAVACSIHAGTVGRPPFGHASLDAPETEKVPANCPFRDIFRKFSSIRRSL